MTECFFYLHIVKQNKMGNQISMDKISKNSPKQEKAVSGSDNNVLNHKIPFANSS